MIENEFDYPVFKILAHNDTGQAAGHQGGLVIPKDLEDFFPLLSRQITPKNPTVDANITAQLYVGTNYVGEVSTRYQYQTWGGTRSPERRLTGNLNSLRNTAVGGDILLIQRHVSNPDLYRLTLIKQNTDTYAQIILNNDARWGVLDSNFEPASEIEVDETLRAIREIELGEFSLFDTNPNTLITHTRRIARSRAFQTRLREIYVEGCSMCGSGLQHLNGKNELEAAHIVPRGMFGSDDPRNGLLLCRAHHWAFDSGMIAIDNQRRIIVPDPIKALPQNSTLLAIEGTKIRAPNQANLIPSIEALEWHSENIFRYT